MIFGTDFWVMWLAAIALLLLLRLWYAGNPRRSQLVMWVLLALFISPIGAVVVYVIVRAIAARPTHRIIEN